MRPNAEPPAWAEKASAMLKAGHSLQGVKKVLGLDCSRSTIMFWTDSAYREKRRAENRANWRRYYQPKKPVKSGG